MITKLGGRRLAAVAIAAALAVPRTTSAAPAQPRPTPPTAAQAAARWGVADGAVRPEAGELAEAVAELRRARGDSAKAAAARRVAGAGLRQAGFTGPLDDQPPNWADVVAVGDLDGDGRADTVQTPFVRNEAGVTTTIVRARRGTDGRLLWEARVPGYASVRGARVGASGAAGVLVHSTVQHAAFSPAALAVAESQSLTAYDGRGTQLWTRPMAPDSFAFTPVGGTFANLPLVFGVGNLLPGKADDVVLGSMSALFTLESADATPIRVVNGADGTVGPAVLAATDAPQGGSFVYVVPDLSGDGLDDLVLTASGNGRVTLMAQPATGGAPAWTATDLPLRWFTPLRALGDVTGDGRGDLAAPSGDQVLVLSGADGSVAATYAGDAAIAIGDVDGDRKRDVAVVRVTVDEPKITVVVTAYRAPGRALYRHVETAGPMTEDDAGFVDVAEFGDVQGDGVRELGIVTFVGNERRTLRQQALLDGRTGRRLHRGAGAPVRLAVDGRGDDLLSVSSPKRGIVRVTALQGSTGRRLWSTDVKSRSSLMFFEAIVTVAHLDGDRCADVVVTFSDEDGSVGAVLRGRDGRAAWGYRTTAAGEAPLSGVTPGTDANRGC